MSERCQKDCKPRIMIFTWFEKVPDEIFIMACILLYFCSLSFSAGLWQRRFVQNPTDKKQIRFSTFTNLHCKWISGAFLSIVSCSLISFKIHFYPHYSPIQKWRDTANRSRHVFEHIEEVGQTIENIKVCRWCQENQHIKAWWGSFHPRSKMTNVTLSNFARDWDHFRLRLFFL